jgi:isoamylase
MSSEESTAVRSANEAGRPREALPGRAHPLGATWDGAGVNFAVYSERATAVELCLFDGDEEDRLPMMQGRQHTWHRYLPGLGPGQRYGFRVDGAYQPQQGLRFNRNKLLVDPYACAITGELDWRGPVFGFGMGDSALDMSFDESDSAPFVPKSVVIDPAFDWEGDTHPNVPWNESIIYEMHVKGLTQQHPDIPEHLRGTYAGLAHPVTLDYLRDLGVTAVELLPVHVAIDELHLFRRGLRNYWGYNTLGYFAPNSRYAATNVPGEEVIEFKEMVRALHAAGIEVILDVVYNHSCEGNEFGPTLSLRGLDNTTYYRLFEGRERYYLDYTGTGNSLNVRHPQVLKLIMDSLRYWVLEMHVDGFRFDLASTLARELHDVDKLSAFFDIIHQDPVISQVKLIAEPWDIGEGGYQVGNFPILWAEWNGQYRDSVRRFWRGDQNYVDDLAYRLTGSSDLYGNDGRGPLASINFITAHDGFTLNDLVSYNEKHNEANGENNRDGLNENYSANYGIEGPTTHPGILDVREREQRNFLATLFLSQGVPMLCGGDEIGRTQRGNNNAYCQDNEISWYDWNLNDRQRQLLEFTRGLIRVRQAHPSLRREAFFRGQPMNGSSLKDIVWLKSDGTEMSHDDWFTSWVQSIGLLLPRDGLTDIDECGVRRTDDTLLLLLNASEYPVIYTLPIVSNSVDTTDGGATVYWEIEVDTSDPSLPASRQLAHDARTLDVASRTMLLLVGHRAVGSRS